MSGRAIEEALVPAGHARADVRAAVKQTVTEGRVSTQPGPHRSTLHHLTPTLEDLIDNTSAPVRRSAPGEPAHPVRQCASASIGRTALHTGEHTDETIKVGALEPDTLTCPRCRLPATRLIPPDDLCPRCAYPAGGAPDDDTEGSA
ncbi:MAG: hypothetical protein ACRDTJ_30245 [Pseudonocardiaceae bacterium]